MDKDICPVCRFPKRISGHVFIKNTESYFDLDDKRCGLCGHLPDYKIINLNPLKAVIIYRNFNGSRKYFKEVENYLKSKDVEVVNCVNSALEEGK